MLLAAVLPVATQQHLPGRAGPTAKTGGGRELGDKEIALGLPQAVQQRLGSGGLYFERLCCRPPPTSHLPALPAGSPRAKTGDVGELGDKEIALGLPQAVQQRPGAGGLYF